MLFRFKKSTLAVAVTRACWSLGGAGLLVSTATVAAPQQEETRETVLPKIEVTAPRDIGHRAERAPSTTKTEVPLLQTPMSVQVVPQALIEDHQANSLREAVQTVSGVFAGATSLHEDLIVRGFPVSDSYRNGARTRRLGLTEIANAERIDILKGPSSTQFGRGDVSGLFNVVTKKPLDSPYYSLQQQIGSERFVQTSLDATGPIGKGPVGYRLNASYEDSDTFRDFVHNRREFIAPTISVRPNDRFLLNVELEYARQDLPIDRGIVAVGNRPANLPRSRNLGESFGRHENTASIFAFDWSYRLNDQWTLRQNALGEAGRGKGFEYLHQLLPDQQTLGRRPRRIEQRDIDTGYTSLELAGRGDWFGVKHELVIGADYRSSRGRFDFRYGDIDVINIYAPIYAGVEPPTPVRSTIENRTRGYGLYVQDQIDLRNQFHLLLGGRYDNARTRLQMPFGTEVSSTHDKEFSPRVGVTWTPSPLWSVYGSYTQSFSDTNFGRSFGGGVFKPTTAKQYEVGFKAETAAKDLFTTVALYDLTKRNILTPDPANPDYSIQTGKANSRGLEWDIGGRLTQHLNLTASYAATRTRVLQANDGTQGNQLYGVPRHSVKGFLRYDTVAGGHVGFSAGIGVTLVSRQQGDQENSVQLPGYGRVDLMGQYKWRAGNAQMTAQLNVTNVGDKTFYLPTGSRNEIAFGKPRTVMASLRAEY